MIWPIPVRYAIDPYSIRPSVTQVGTDDVANMDHEVSTTTKNDIGSLLDEEVHWIESESLFSTTKTSTNGNTVNNNNGHNEDLCLDDLFMDPDPYETFTLQWKILYIQNDGRAICGSIGEEGTGSNGSCCVIETTAQITVVGNKAENGQTLHSTGLTLWRASQSLTDYLVAEHNRYQNSLLQQQQQQHFSIPDTRISPYFTTTRRDDSHINVKPIKNLIAVLELGCGLGVPSMLYHYYLSSSLLPPSVVSTTNTITIATDADIDTLRNLRQNLVRVQKEQEDLLALSSDTANLKITGNNIMACQQLIWGNSMHIQSVLQTLHSYRDQIEKCTTTTTTTTQQHPTTSTDNKNTTCIESSTGMTTTDAKFDILLGSDIIYVEHVVEPLFDTVSQLLSSHGVFLLAFARRNVSIDYVLYVAQRQGFVYEYKELSAMNDDTSATSASTNHSSSMEGVYIFRLLPI